MNNDTIFALSSAAGQAGVAVIRVSGSETLTVYNALTGKENPKERYLQCNYILDKDKAQIDQAMTVYFKAPKSFTGEDVLEIHCHGSRAVIEKILSVLSEIKGCRMAERGEFTRRAVYHNKMDLTSAEGLIDLISSDTQQQRKWALRQMGGELQRLYDSWRQILVHNRAYLEAFIDFPEEEIPPQRFLPYPSNILCAITFGVIHTIFQQWQRFPFNKDEMNESQIFHTIGILPPFMAYICSGVSRYENSVG